MSSAERPMATPPRTLSSMDVAQPSQMALAAARHRAAHQVLEQGRIFTDPLALRILGDDAAAAVRRAREYAASRSMRVFVAARSRFAEDTLEQALDRGGRQVVILGAGLDTYAYRCPRRNRLRVFEVDHPATQMWKRQLLQAAAIPMPDTLTLAAIDFERESLADGLARAGFDRDAATFFVWLGVVPYLTEMAVWSTLAFIAGLPGSADVVFDYSDPPESLTPEARARHDARAVRLASLGEPLLTHFDPDRLRAEMAALGFARIEDLDPPSLAERYYPDQARTRSSRGGHVVHAATA
jgi:methyltransferase (TIGR00027 family)